jgi:diguanylate cyclase (GGDEF)-like protein
MDASTPCAASSLPASASGALPFDGVDPRRRARGVLIATIVFLILICIALLSLNALLASRTRESEIRQADVATTNLTRAMSEQTNAMVSEIEHILDSFVYELEREDVTQDALLRLQPLLVTQTANVKQLKDIFIYGSDGQLASGSQPIIEGAAAASEWSFFSFHRDSPSERLRIGTPLMMPAAGPWVIPLTRRFNDAEGHFAGVVLATIEVDHVLRFMQRFDIGQKGAAGIFLDSGELLARRPYAERDLGKSFAGTVLHEEMGKHRSGRTTMVSPIDRVLRRISFEQVADQPLKISVALSQEELLAEWRHATNSQTAIVLALCLLTGAGGWFLLRAIHHRGKVEAYLFDARNELRQANARLEHIAQHDGLTGLPNRRFFDDFLQMAITQSVRTRQPVALVMIDVDYFKRYNDRYGHPAGDRCLRAVADALKSAACRPTDLITRYGGEEFAAILPATDLAGATTVAETMRQAVMDLGIEHSDSPACSRVTVSLGISVRSLQDSALNASKLLHDADFALYRAKSEGRNRVSVLAADDEPNLIGMTGGA